MAASPFCTHEALRVSPIREGVGFPPPFTSTSKTAADSAMGEGAEPPAECAAATARQSSPIVFDVGVKPVDHCARRRPRRCSDAGGARQTGRSERSSWARQDSTTDTEESAIGPAIGIAMQDVTSGAANGEPSDAGAARTATSSIWEHHLPDAPPHNSYSDACNASVPTLSADTANSVGCTEVPPVTAVEIEVPTQFTTAAGRAICVRERRLLVADSPYWKLLRFDPAREAIVAPPDSSIDECGDEEEADGDDSGELYDTVSSAKRAAEQLPTDSAAALEGATGQSSYEGSASTVSPLAFTYAGYALLHPCVRRRRAASCPERFADSRSYPRMGGNAYYSLPPFSGFCAADGRPFYCR
ncbi:hypothetical protein JIQ42_05099 [Leishmania sp. Namibia]|uniref:hypothetical protein n=1 Tax=Leishmania sp. Namibia TaxID=2802991 RepID=UPI001B708261|nr:hypothetical protein JIQ42_05099 [Leishmania sp. Namibia]